MKKWFGIFFLLMLVGFGALAYVLRDDVAWGTWNYRITVEIETPEGLKSGSAVRQVSNSAMNFGLDLPDVGNPAEVKGEAVVVDLGDRGKLFALISSASDRELYYAFPYKDGMNGVTTVGGIKHFNSLKPGALAELTKDIPQMVMFKDMNDPKSVTLVRGGRFNAKTQKHDPVDDFEALFGEGVKFKRVTIEITDDPVSWGIREVLPWLSDLISRRARLNGSTSVAITTNELSDNLGSGSFSIGGKK